MHISRRGVWVAPWQGPNGEFVLFSLDSRSKLVAGPMTVTIGGDHIAAAEALWEELDARDPGHRGHLGAPATFRRLRRSWQRSGLQLIKDSSSA